MRMVFLIAALLFCFFMFSWAGQIKDRSSIEEWKRIGSFIEAAMGTGVLVGWGLLIAILNRL